MKNRFSSFKKVILVFFLVVLGTSFITPVFSVKNNYNEYSGNFTYSVKVGDKLPYKVTILKNGNITQGISVFGLNLSQGDQFYMEILEAKSSFSSAIGSSVKMRFVTDNQTGHSGSGETWIYTNSSSYWRLAHENGYYGGANSEETLDGYILNQTAYYDNGKDFVSVAFNIYDGIIEVHDRKTSRVDYYNYTRFRFERIGDRPTGPTLDLSTTPTSTTSTESTPVNTNGFILPFTVIGLLMVSLTVNKRRRNK